MYNVLHHILLGLYAVLPMAAVLAAFWPGNAWRRGRLAGSLMLSISAGVALGLLLSYLEALGHAVVRYGPFLRLYFPQIARTCYFVVGLLTLLKMVNAALDYLGRRVCRRFANARLLPPMIFLGRSLFMLVIGVPFFCGGMICFLPKIVGAGVPPQTFQRVSLNSSDHMKLAAWWIPAARGGHGHSSDRTVILCHGLGGSKARELPLAQRLVERGYNVLALDLRGHGESEGTFTSFGDLERRDVLAAVRFVKTNHAAASRQIFCVGAGIGAAASVAAAADSDPDAQLIDAVVAIGGYADFSAVPETSAARFLPMPLARAFARLTLPSLAAHAGSNLSEFSPGDLAGKIWPRPILVIHRSADAMISAEQSEALFGRAAPPRRQIWLDGDTDRGHRPADVNDQLAELIDAFLRHAEKVPVI